MLFCAAFMLVTATSVAQDADFHAAVDALNTRSFEHKIAAVTKLAAFAHPRAITVLTALLEGSLYVTKKTKQVVIVVALDEGGYAIKDAATGADLGIVGRRAAHWTSVATPVGCQRWHVEY